MHAAQIDLMKFLTSGEITKLDKKLAQLEKDTGFKVRVLCQQYPNTPGLAIKDYWKLDDNVRARTGPMGAPAQAEPPDRRPTRRAVAVDRADCRQGLQGDGEPAQLQRRRGRQARTAQFVLDAPFEHLRQHLLRERSTVQSGSLAGATAGHSWLGRLHLKARLATRWPPSVASLAHVQVREQGEDAAVVRAIDSIDYCLREGFCVDVPAQFKDVGKGGAVDALGFDVPREKDKSLFGF